MNNSTQSTAAELRTQARAQVLEAQRLVGELRALLDDDFDAEMAECSLQDAAAYLEPEAPVLRVVPAG